MIARKRKIKEKVNRLMMMLPVRIAVNPFLLLIRANSGSDAKEHVGDGAIVGAVVQLVEYWTRNREVAGSNGDAENAGLEKAGLELNGPSCKTGQCRTGIKRTKSQDWKMQDWN